MRRIVPWFIASFAAACDGQTGPDYPGEKLATVRGTVFNERSIDVPAAEISLVWAVTGDSPDYSVATTESVRGAFPSAFQIDLYVPPPDDALNDYTLGGRRPDETRIGVAYLVVGEAGQVLITDETAVLGGVERHVLIYVESDVQPGTNSAALLHSTPSAGYHLMVVVDEGQIFDQLYGAPDGLDTTVEASLVDDLQEFDLPNWS